MYIIQYKLFKYSVFAMENKQLDTLENSDVFNSCKITSEFVSSKENLKRNFDMKKIIEKIAWIFHENWRKSKIDENGVYESVIEKSKDEVWTKEHWTEVVDIANTKFEDLPRNWQRENIEAAKVAVELVYQKVVDWEEITSEMIEEMSKIVHEKRFERNWEHWSFENQRVEYEKLSEEEKEKDRIQIKLAIQIIKSEI